MVELGIVVCGVVRVFWLNNFVDNLFDDLVCCSGFLFVS